MPRATIRPRERVDSLPSSSVFWGFSLVFWFWGEDREVLFDLCWGDGEVVGEESMDDRCRGDVI